MEYKCYSKRQEIELLTGQEQYYREKHDQLSSIMLIFKYINIEIIPYSYIIGIVVVFYQHHHHHYSLLIVTEIK